jgi:hypothetical protein
MSHPQMDSNEAFARAGTNEYITYKSTVYAWDKGDVKFRIIFPAGQNTDLMSSPVFARFLGFKKEDPRTWEASKIHDFLCFHIRYNRGVLPEGSYQFWNPENRQFENCHSYRWTFQEADEMFKKILVRNGFPQWEANKAYWSLRAFGWLYRMLKK